MSILLKFLQIYIYSFIATAFFLPVSSLDVYYTTTFNLETLWYIFPMIILVEVINANIIYKFSRFLSSKIIKSEKKKEQLKKIQDKINGYGFWGIVLAGATPLPYSLVLYSLGAVKWGNVRKFSLAVLIGRSIKYIGLSLIAYYGIQLFI